MAEYEPLLPVPAVGSPKKGFSLFGSRKVVPSATPVRSSVKVMPNGDVGVQQSKQVKTSKETQADPPANKPPNDPVACKVSSLCRCCVNDDLCMRKVNVHYIYSIPNTIIDITNDNTGAGNVQTFSARRLRFGSIFHVPLDFTGEHRNIFTGTIPDSDVVKTTAGIEPIAGSIEGNLVSTFKDGHCVKVDFTRTKLRYAEPVFEKALDDILHQQRTNKVHDNSKV